MASVVRRAKVAAILGLFLLAARPAPVAAFEKWWGGSVRFQLGWPPLAFGSGAQKQDEVEKLLLASLTPEAWARAAPTVRSITRDLTRAEVEAAIGVKTYRITTPEGRREHVRIADGYLDAISTSRRMEFGYVDHRIMIRKWIVLFDDAGKVRDTEVFPDGRNDALLREPPIPDDEGHQPMRDPYDVDTLVAPRRGTSFMSHEAWARARKGLEKLQPGDSRDALEAAVNLRYYLLGHKAWAMGDGYLPGVSIAGGSSPIETLVFGWAEHRAPIVKARVVLKDDTVRSVQLEE